MSKNAKRVVDVSSVTSPDRKISELPYELLPHIQYHLSPKQAAQTCTLSKSWLNAWSNHEVFDFDENDFEGTQDEFMSLVNNTLQDYHDHKLRIKDFRLILSMSKLDKKWIPILVHMGVNIFHLTTSSEYDLCSSIFEAESIIELSLNGCRLLDVDKVMFKHLKVLKLSGVNIVTDTLQRIISRCRSIEDMELISCEGLKFVKLNDLHNLKKFYFVYYDAANYRVLTGPTISMDVDIAGSLTSITIFYYDKWLHEQTLLCFLNLEYLSLKNVNLPEIFFRDFLSNFPALETLILDECYGFEEIEIITSDSFRNFSLLGMDRSIKGRIVSTGIRRFVYSGDFPSIVSFETTSSYRTSDINLNFNKGQPRSVLVAWVETVNEMVKQLTESEISLALTTFPFNYDQQEHINVVQFTPWEEKNVEMIWQNDSKEVIVNYYDENLQEWRSLPHGTSDPILLPNPRSLLTIRYEYKSRDAYIPA